MVLQDTWLFGGTIRDNIAYGRPDATEERDPRGGPGHATSTGSCTRCPTATTPCSTTRAATSAPGEKQLITIARAFLADPALLILDEATSSVDTRTEVLVQHAMAALRADRTSFVIAHRLSTIRDADLILVMEDGRIVEQGTHDELLARARRLRRLYKAQFARRPTRLRCNPVRRPADSSPMGYEIRYARPPTNSRAVAELDGASFGFHYDESESARRQPRARYLDAYWSRWTARALSASAPRCRSR